MRPDRFVIDPGRVLELTRDLIRIPSGTFEEADVARFLAKRLAEIGLEVDLQSVPGPRNTEQVIARLRGKGGGRNLLLCGHLDTWAARGPSVWVEAETDAEWQYFQPEKWTKPPFAGEVEDGWIYGVGALDQKGGLAAMSLAVEALVTANAPLRGDVVVAGFAAEGAGGHGAKHFVDQGAEIDMAIVTEFTNLDVVTISVGGIQGRLTITGDPWLFPPRVDAVSQMLVVLNALGPIDDPQPTGSWLRFEPHTSLPGYPRLAVRSISTALGSCEVLFDVRSVPGMTEASLREDVENVIRSLRERDPDLRIDFEIPAAPTLSWPATPETDPSLPLVRAVSDAHEGVTGRAGTAGAGSRLGAVSDRGHLSAAGIDVVEYGPGLGRPWPMVDERCRVEDITATAQVLALATAELCA
jgi:acetylornithine deacetylase